MGGSTVQRGQVPAERVGIQRAAGEGIGKPRAKLRPDGDGIEQAQQSGVREDGIDQPTARKRRRKIDVAPEVVIERGGGHQLRYDAAAQMIGKIGNQDFERLRPDYQETQFACCLRRGCGGCTLQSSEFVSGSQDFEWRDYIAIQQQH